MAESNGEQDNIKKIVKDSLLQTGKITAQSIGGEAFTNQKVQELAEHSQREGKPVIRKVIAASLLQAMAPTFSQLIIGENRLEKLDPEYHNDKFNPRTDIALAGAFLLDFGSLVARMAAFRNNPDALIASQFSYNTFVNGVFETSNIARTIVGKNTK